MVFSVGDNISDTGNMRFVASKLESIKKSIEKYKRAKTELSYTDIWGAFGNMMDYIQFFNMGTAKSMISYNCLTMIAVKNPEVGHITNVNVMRCLTLTDAAIRNAL